MIEFKDHIIIIRVKKVDILGATQSIYISLSCSIRIHDMVT